MQRTLPNLFKLPKLLRFNKTPDVLTLFHSPTSSTSVRVLSLLQSLQHPPGTSPSAKTPPKFELDIISHPQLPTTSQYKSIIEFLGGESHAKRVLKGIRDADEGERILGEREKAGVGEGIGAMEVELVRPILVDWNNGRVVVGADEEEVRNLVETLPED